MKKVLAVMTAVTAVVVIGLALLPAASADAEANNWFVCKYVGPPGTPDETLAGGNNPIFVDENAIDVSPVVIGATFGDAQTHSVVIAGPFSPTDKPDPEPTCPTTTTTTTTVPPPTTTAPPPPVTSCPGKVKLGPWYGDPQINITLTGKGTFVVSGGKQRFSGIHKFTETLDCNVTFKIGRYKVSRGHFLTITQDGVVVVHQKPPRFN